MASEAGGRLPLRKPNPVAAAALCVVPGLGQLYNLQPRKALFFFIGTLLTLGPALALITEGQQIGHALLDAHAEALFLAVALVSVLAFLALFLTGLFLWSSSAVDAWHSANAIAEGRRDEAAARRLFRL